MFDFNFSTYVSTLKQSHSCIGDKHLNHGFCLWAHRCWSLCWPSDEVECYDEEAIVTRYVVVVLVSVSLLLCFSLGCMLIG